MTYSPTVLEQFIGQEHIKKPLVLHIQRSNDLIEPFPHTAFFGPPGLGKTTLARIMSNELGVAFEEITGKMLGSVKEVKYKLLSLTPRDIMFIDEIHSLRRDVLELLYSPLQDFRFGEFDINPFTLIGATTHMGKLPKPLRDRIVHAFEFALYHQQEIADILTAQNIDKEVADFIAQRSKGVPRLASGRYLPSALSYAHAEKSERVTIQHCTEMFNDLAIDDNGLDRRERHFLRYMAEEHAIDASSAIGQDTIAKSMGIPVDDYVHVVEPFLLLHGFIKRTGRGRILTKMGFDYARTKCQEG